MSAPKAEPANVTVQIMARGRWVQDGRNKDITEAKARRRVEKLAREERMARLLRGGEVIDVNAQVKVVRFLQTAVYGSTMFSESGDKLWDFSGVIAHGDR